MLFIDLNNYEKDFQRNLEDWCLGGPKKSGWTREGEEIKLTKKIFVKNFLHEYVDIDQVLEKNFREVQKWHIDFLNNNKNIEKTKYYIEYLFPRYNFESIYFAKKFLKLFQTINLKGFNKKNPIMLADISSLNLGFKYFRFDGCHRAACCKVLGFKKIFSLVFKTTEK
jgi:hypothetical protein